MELRHCRYFLAVHEIGNITQAAAKLGISQPSLSLQIRQFEDRLGVKLFDRMGRAVRLTAAGEILVPHARNLVQAAENAKLEVAGSEMLTGGKLSIAFIPSLERPVSEAIATFIRSFPRIKINLRQQMGREIDRLILSGEVELGIAISRVSPPEITEKVLYQEPYVLAFRQGHALQKTKLSKLSMIGDTPFAIFSFGSFSRDTTDSYLRKIKFTPNICLEAESLENLLNIITHTDICAMLPKHAVVRRSDIGYHELTSPRPSRSVAVLSHRRGSTSPAAREFTKTLRAQAIPDK